MLRWILATLLFTLVHIRHCKAIAPAGPWDSFNYAPSDRTVHPKIIHSVYGLVQNSNELVGSTTGQATFNGEGSYVVLDFGQEVGGMLSLSIDKSDPGSALSLSFTESSQFISPFNSDDSCRATATRDGDGIQSLPSPLPLGIFTQTIGQQRGGFKYLTIVSSSDASVTISNVSLHTTWMPHWDDLRAYTGYFFAHDPGFHDADFLTKLWYAGAYTVQTNTIDSHQARQQPCPNRQGWSNDASGGPVVGPILVDGAKRDRNIWPGDMGISSHTELVALNDLLPSKNALAVMFSTQDPTTGSLQYSGPPINAHGSDTYICWTLIGTHNYYLYTGDLEFVRTVWGNFTKALSFMESQIDATGLVNVPLQFANDWGRDNGQGHNSAANAIMYRALITAADLASHLGDIELSVRYTVNATSLKQAYNRVLWDGTVEMYHDSDTSSLIPQDGNALAVLFNVTNTGAQIQAISQGLTKFWTDIGPLSPELNDTIIPFIGGFEIQAHFIAGQGERALDLLHKGKYRAAAGANFDHSFTSHSHGWATGPTPALTFFVLGLTLTSAQGKTWSVAPVLSGLSAAEGGFETGLGWFGVKWGVKNGILSLLLDAPRGTWGSVTIPGSGSIHIDGELLPVSAGSSMELSGGHHFLIRRL